MPTFNALVLAGGRSSRLGGSPKAGLSNGSETLLESTLAAVAQARYTVLVGPDSLPAPDSVLLTREDPPFSGPAAAISAGLSALPADRADWTLIFAVDMPGCARALEILLAAVAQAPETIEGFAGVTDGIFQPLAGIYRTASLARVFAADTANAGVRRFIKEMNYAELELPAGSTADIDDWDAAAQHGYTQQTHPVTAWTL